MAELTARVFMEYEDGRVVPFESLSREEVDAWRERMSKRLSIAMSAYYSNHLDEFARL